ncbi:MAG: AI-2E family transporter [Ruminococcus sp.]|nr:AI-2E family transporter [Ruminococcus sp.]
MKINWNSKYTTISVYTILTFTVCILIYAVLFNFTVIGDFIRKMIKILAPIIWGIVIAYLVNPIMKWIEKRLSKVIEKNKPHFKITRILSLSFAMIVFLAVISALGAIILPQVIESITTIINNISTYINNFEKWIDSFLVKYPELLTIVSDQIDNIEKAAMEFANNIAPKLGDIMMKITDSTLSFIVAVKDVLIGIIVAVYLLYGKEHFQAQMKKMVYGILPSKITETILRVCAQTNSSISGFISGKIVDSIIIGCLCFICMTVMKFDFIVLISVIVGVTNIIPFFGPFIGAIPSALLLLVAAPKQVIPFLILVLIIQQLDGNVIGPKILGQTTGISAFWVLFSILVGGGLFGFAGMILGVPVFAVLYSLLNEFIAYRLEGRDMSSDTNDYLPERCRVALVEKKNTKAKKSDVSQNKKK